MPRLRGHAVRARAVRGLTLRCARDPGASAPLTVMTCPTARLDWLARARNIGSPTSRGGLAHVLRALPAAPPGGGREPRDVARLRADAPRRRPRRTARGHGARAHRGAGGDRHRGTLSGAANAGADRPAARRYPCPRDG